MCLHLHQQLAFAVAHVVEGGFTTFIFPLHHIVLPDGTAGTCRQDGGGQNAVTRGSYKNETPRIDKVLTYQLCKRSLLDLFHMCFHCGNIPVICE